MKSFLLLILSLMTGCEASSKAGRCQKGCIEFTCKYPKAFGCMIDNPKGSCIASTELKDSEENESNFDQGSSSEEKAKQKPKECHEKDDCQGEFLQTAYKTSKTTITCDYPGNRYKSSVKFVSKEKDLICEDILSTKPSPKSKEKFSPMKTNSGLIVSISNVSSDEAGVYWCGVESSKGCCRAALRKIQLKVEIVSTFSKSLTAGQNLTYWCTYPIGAPDKKFLCKGEDPSICQPLVNTKQLNVSSRFSMNDGMTGKRNITITVREVTTADTGTYWCGAESTDKTRSNPFFHRLLMTVGPSNTLTPSTISSTSSISSTESTSALSENDAGFPLTVIIAVVACVAVLVLVLTLVLLYKRFEHSKNRHAEALNNKEDRAYEEKQERPQKPDSGTALKTIYVTATFPTNPSSASDHYSTANFQSSSVEGSGDRYSTVRDSDQHPTYSTVNHPSRLSEDPEYSTVNKPQRR